MNVERIKEPSNGMDEVTMPLSEDTILKLHHMFTTVGVHTIQVKNVVEGRRIVHAILDSLQWYHEIAYISEDSRIDFQRDAKNLFSELDRCETEAMISDFFISHFHYDFLYIEATPTIKQKKWLPLFKEQLKVFHIDVMMPVLVLEYVV